MKKRVIYTPGDSETLSEYLHQISRYPVLDKSEEHELAVAMRKGSEKARTQLINSNLRYVVTIAKRYMKPEIDLQDLIQAGNVGLIAAISKFDPEQGVRVSTFATEYIKKGVMNHLSKDKIVYLPDHEMRAIKSGNSVHYDIEHIDNCVSDESEITLSECLPCDPSDWPDHTLIKDSISEQVNSLLCTITEKKAKVVSMAYGLKDGFEHVPSVIAEELGISRERVRQSLNEAIAVMQKKCIDPCICKINNPQLSKI